MTDTNTAEREAAEQWLRDRYGAYRGHFAWRELEEAFLAGRASLAASAGSEPVAWRDPSNMCDDQSFTLSRERAKKWPHIYKQPLYTHPSPPEGMVAVPKEFIRAFSDTAHNYQLSVEPPDHFSGTEGDAFRAAYARCGVELLRLRGILIGPLPASEAKEL